MNEEYEPLTEVDDADILTGGDLEPNTDYTGPPGECDAHEDGDEDEDVTE